MCICVTDDLYKNVKFYIKTNFMCSIFILLYSRALNEEKKIGRGRRKKEEVFDLRFIWVWFNKIAIHDIKLA